MSILDLPRPPVPTSLKESLEHSMAEYVQLGSSGLRISIPIFGCMSLGNREWAPWVIEEAEALPLLKAAYDRGINTWDTANVYSNGVSEQIIGKAIKKYDIPRHKVIICTKVNGPCAEEPSIRGAFYPQELNRSKDYVNQSGLSRHAIFNQVTASLARLDTEYVDLLQIHRFDYNTPIEETMAALHDLVKMGKVRYIGASSMWTYQFAQMQFCAERNGWTRFVSMQNQYSLLYREEEREMNRFCGETGVGLIPWAALSRGNLAQPLSRLGSTMRSGPDAAKGLPAVDCKIIDRVEEVAEKRGWTMAQVALVWLCTRVSSPLIGFESIERMDEALEVKGKKLSEVEGKYLEELYVPKAVNGHT